jgi:hypothetical protein
MAENELPLQTGDPKLPLPIAQPFSVTFPSSIPRAFADFVGTIFRNVLAGRGKGEGICL